MEALAAGMKQHRCDPVLPVHLSSTSPASARFVAVHLRDLFGLHRRQLDSSLFEMVLAGVILAKMALAGLDSERTQHPPEL